VATELETAPAEQQAADARTEPAPSRATATWVLALIVLVAFVAYAGLAQLVGSPRVFPDEIIYGEAAASLGEGGGLRLRGEEYDYGPLFPAVVAPAFALVDDRATAYHLLKAINALLFALVAIPAYLLGRRVLDRRWSLAVAVLAVLIPSSMLVGLVMTETLAYLATAWLLYAIAIALERPRVGRQLVVLAGTLVAYAVRPQLAGIYGAYLVALPLRLLFLPGAISRWKETARALWPTALSLALAALVLAAPLVGGSSPLGAYEVLWRSYDPLVVARWLVYHLADLELYLAVVPLAVAPVALVSLVRRGRAGSERSAAFAALFLAANAVGLLVVAVFASTEFGFDRLHDRNIFYLVPLWLVLLAVWLDDGLPRPRWPLASGAILALALPLVLPFRHVSSEVGVDVVTSALWGWIQEGTAGVGPLNGRRLLVLFVVAAVLAAAALPRRYRLAFPALVVVVFAATAVLAWERQIDAPENAVFAGSFSGNKTWIDDALDDRARVTKLYADVPCGSTVIRHALYLTEFFNSSVDRAAYVGSSVPDGLPISPVAVAPDGRLLLPTGKALVADHVYTQPGLELKGTRVAQGTAAALVLWRVEGSVAVRGARSNGDLADAACP
jgi:hypothetical protein